ncbi:MAG TPA: AAA family ATPase [Candidatus Deferrimicrobium sp.]|nr:AAA family ATPase [Candidatus Kapabacteria bacterium]HLP62073.1 AAA family ATPase [Candidatus Deferrimicrobium sp.]
MKEAHDLKKIPYGVSDFNDFKIKNLHYVDKTRFIRNIEENESIKRIVAETVSIL